MKALLQLGSKAPQQKSLSARQIPFSFWSYQFLNSCTLTNRHPLLGFIWSIICTLKILTCLPETQEQSGKGLFHGGGRLGP